MKKNTSNSQSLINNILIAAVTVLAVYSAALTYVVLSNQKASQNITDGLAQQIFELQTKSKNN